MNKQLPLCLRLSTLLLLGVCGGCSEEKAKTMFTDTDQSEFKVGQVWNYKTRAGEEESKLVILKVETAPRWSTVVHIGVTGLKFKTAKGLQDTLPHLPIDETALKSSVTTKVSEKGTLTNFQEGYELWREAASSGKGGVFTLSVAEVVSTVEEGLNKAQKK